MKEKLNDTVIRRMIEVLSASLSGVPISRPCGDCWDGISSELEKQAVQFVPANVIESLGLSNDQYIKYQNECGKSVRSFYSKLSSQEKILDILEKNSIRAAVLKGASAALNYPRPELRSMGDIDIIVLPEDFERARKILSQSGYKDHKEEQLERHHCFVDENNCDIELHRFFSASKEKDANEYLDNVIYDGIRNREYAQIEKYRFPILPPIAEAGVLVAHINQHLIYGLGLRQIIDWGMFADRHIDDNAWKSDYKQTLSNMKLLTLAKASVAMCKKYFHICTRISWCDDISESICDDLMNYLLQRGNFGNAEDYGSKGTTNVLVQFRSIRNIFLYFQKGGETHWKACQKYPILKPLAWIHQLGHVIKMAVSNKVGLSTMIKSGRDAQSNFELMKKLEITNY